MKERVLTEMGQHRIDCHKDGVSIVMMMNWSSGQLLHHVWIWSVSVRSFV